VPPTRSPSASACEPYRELIELGLARGRNAMAIWQDLVSEAGFTSGYQSVRRFVGKLRGAQIPQAHPVIATAPGEEAQVDYGTDPMVRDPQSGKYRRTRLFVLTLDYSRKSVRLLVFQSNSRTWAELHEKVFRRLGARFDSSSSTTYARACWSPISTIPRSILSTATSSRTTVPWP
jgi:transposase